jgi:endonuclease G
VKHPDQIGIDAVWIISGPVYFDDDEDGPIEESELQRIGEDVVARSDATYKVIAWEDDNGLKMRAYMIEQNDTDVDLTNYLRSVDEIEAFTGLDFFPNLDDATENTLEAIVADSLWN